MQLFWEVLDDRLIGEYGGDEEYVGRNGHSLSKKVYLTARPLKAMLEILESLVSATSCSQLQY